MSDNNFHRIGHSPPRIVTSCRSRFHIFDQARELARHGALHRLITDYPKFWPMRFGVPKELVQPMLLSAFINHSLSRFRVKLPAEYRIFLDRWVHNRFSRRLKSLIPEDTQFFIGLSSFCLDALLSCREAGMPCAVDHGSLHQKEDARLVCMEAERWGLPVPPDIAADWVMEKEDREFQVADHVFVLSSVARESLIKNGVVAEKIFVNACGVDISAFSSGQRKNNNEIFRILQVGGISLRKGVLTLLNSYSRLDRKSTELCFVGAGAISSGLRPFLDRMYRRNVVFHSPVPQDRLCEFYNRSDVFVLASVADGFGMVVLQAMASGLPVIVTENVGAKDLVSDGVNGFIVPVGAPEVITERLQRLYDDRGLCFAMGEAARRTVVEGCTWKDYGDRLINFIEMHLVK